MKHKYILPLIAVFIFGAILYTALLWEPLGGWLFEYVITPMSIGPQNRNPDFLEGMGIILVCFVVLLLIFSLPYILLWGVIIALLLRRKDKTEF
jgi:hypothetical protein